MQRQGVDKRARSVWAFSLLFAYVLSFLFEGKALYGLLEKGGVAPATYVLTAIVAHFFGLFTCGLFLQIAARGKSDGACKHGALPAAYAAVFLCAIRALVRCAGFLRLCRGLRRRRMGIFPQSVYAKG